MQPKSLDPGHLIVIPALPGVASPNSSKEILFCMSGSEMVAKDLDPGMESSPFLVSNLDKIN